MLEDNQLKEIAEIAIDCDWDDARKQRDQLLSLIKQADCLPFVLRLLVRRFDVSLENQSSKTPPSIFDIEIDG